MARVAIISGVCRTYGLIGMMGLLWIPFNSAVAADQIELIDYRLRLIERLANLPNLDDVASVSSVIQSKLHIVDDSVPGYTCRNLCYKLVPDNEAVAKYVTYRVRNVAGHKIYSLKSLQSPIKQPAFMYPLSEIDVHVGQEDCMGIEHITTLLSGFQQTGPSQDYMQLVVRYPHLDPRTDQLSTESFVSFGTEQNPIRPCVDVVIIQEFPAPERPH